MASQGNPTVGRRLLGIELRRLRLAAELTLDQVAEELEMSESKASRMETGRVRVSVRDVRDLLRLYEPPGEERDRLLQMARDARRKGWWHAFSDVSPSPYLGLEDGADEIRIYEAGLVPGLLQTAAYAQTVIRTLRPNLSPEQVDRWVQLREVRQAVLKVVWLESRTREHFLETDEELRLYHQAFGQLRALALDPAASTKLLGELAEQL